MNLTDEFSNAFHDLITAEPGTADLHEFCHGFAVAGSFKNLQAEECHRLGMVQLEAPLQASLSQQGGGHHQEFVFLLRREMHQRGAASDTLAKKCEP